VKLLSKTKINKKKLFEFELWLVSESNTEKYHGNPLTKSISVSPTLDHVDNFFSDFLNHIRKEHENCIDLYTSLIA
jgi:hypothetical protein